MFVTAKKKLMLLTSKLVIFVLPFPVKYIVLRVDINYLVTITVTTQQQQYS